MKKKKYIIRNYKFPIFFVLATGQTFKYFTSFRRFFPSYIFLLHDYFYDILNTEDI